MEKTAMQALIDLISINDAYKESMPFLLDIINEVYLPKEKQQIIKAYTNGSPEFFDMAKEYYNETYGAL